MKLEDLKTLVRNSAKRNESLPLADLIELKKLTNVTLEIDRDTNDYYYMVNLKDLVGKEFKYEILSDNPWTLSLDEKYIFLFL